MSCLVRGKRVISHMIKYPYSKVSKKRATKKINKDENGWIWLVNTSIYGECASLAFRKKHK
jgi:hypothetical protein